MIRQTTGSVICPSCHTLVGVNDERCYQCGRRNPGLWGFNPLLRRLGQDMGIGPFIIGTCVVLYALSLLLSRGNISMNGFGFLGPSLEAMFMLGSSGYVPVYTVGRWWTLLSAGWLHGGALHILFNMMWVRQLMPAVVDLYGPGRAIIIYVLSSAVGFFLTSTAFIFFGSLPIPPLSGATFSIGASASLFGLLGALVCYGQRSGSSYISSQAKGLALTMFIFGLVMPGVDNYAHAGGFVGGYVLARWMNPLKPERLDHIFIGLGLLLLCGLAILWSFISSLQYVLR